MPMYQRKPFRAQQWNKTGDVPSFAWGMVTEASDGFTLKMGDKIVHGEPGDYICQRPDRGFVYICRRDIFEANNTPLEGGFNQCEDERALLAEA